MKLKTHRSLFHTLVIFALLSALLHVSCKKDPVPVPPALILLNSPGAISQDTQAAMGDTLHFHLQAMMGSEKLTLLKVKINGQTSKDSSFSSEGFTLHLVMVKGADTLETIQFMVRDRQSQEASVTVNISLNGGVTWGPLVRLQNLELGAQNNTSVGGFFSFADTMVRTLPDAFLHQGVVDLIYYFEAGDENTLASPGANLSATIFTGPYALTQWSTLRTTRFKKITLTPQQFQGCQNDSLLIASYGTGDGNRKAKNLAAGDYFSFKTDDGRFGIVSVNSVSGSDSGVILIDLIAQKK